MGADGHVEIYDYEILCTVLGKKELNGSDFEGYHTYVHEIFGKKIVTNYYDDNIISNYCLVCGKEDCDGDGLPWDAPRPLSKKHFEMIKPARITEWEVWT